MSLVSVTDCQQLSILLTSMGKDIQFELASEDISWPVFVDEAQFEGALVNLLINARDAMRDGGRLTMSVANDEKRQMVKITVTDTGNGMTQDVLDKVFDPFFTTKKEEKVEALD